MLTDLKQIQYRAGVTAQMMKCLPSTCKMVSCACNSSTVTVGTRGSLGLHTGHTSRTSEFLFQNKMRRTTEEKKSSWAHKCPCTHPPLPKVTRVIRVQSTAARAKCRLGMATWLGRHPRWLKLGKVVSCGSRKDAILKHLRKGWGEDIEGEPGKAPLESDFICLL